MNIDRAQRLLGIISEDFRVDILCAPKTREQIEASLRQHGVVAKRERPLRPLLVFWVVLAMCMHRNLSIPNVLAKLLAACPRWPAGESRRPVTDGAIAHARLQVGAKPFRTFFEAVGADAALSSEPFFHGMKVRALDGTHLTMPDTKVNEERFLRHKASRGRSAWPQMRAVALVDVASRKVLCANLGTIKQGERELAVPLYAAVLPGEVVVDDRGFFRIEHLWQLNQRGVYFLSRIPKNTGLRKVQRIGKGDYVVELQGRRQLQPGEGMLRKSLRRGGPVKFRLKVRLIISRIRGCDKPVMLVTNLLDPKITARELAILYHARWETELCFDELKTHLATVTHGKSHTTFRGKSPELVEQEFWAMLAIYNLVRGRMADAAQHQGLDPRFLSFVDSLCILHDRLADIQKAPTSRLVQLARHLLAELAAATIDRPRRPRSCPRVVKVKMSNYRLRRADCTEIELDIERDLLLINKRLAS